MSIIKEKNKISEILCTGDFEGDTDIASPYIREKTRGDYFNILNP
jgi:hypothetical protein